MALNRVKTRNKLVGDLANQHGLYDSDDGIDDPQDQSKSLDMLSSGQNSNYQSLQSEKLLDLDFKKDSKAPKKQFNFNANKARQSTKLNASSTDLNAKI